MLKNIVHELLHSFNFESGITKEQASLELAFQYAFQRVDIGPLLLAEAFIEGRAHMT